MNTLEAWQFDAFTSQVQLVSLLSGVLGSAVQVLVPSVILVVCVSVQYGLRAVVPALHGEGGVRYRANLQARADSFEYDELWFPRTSSRQVEVGAPGHGFRVPAACS